MATKPPTSIRIPEQRRYGACGRFESSIHVGDSKWVVTWQWNIPSAIPGDLPSFANDDCSVTKHPEHPELQGIEQVKTLLSFLILSFQFLSVSLSIIIQSSNHGGFHGHGAAPSHHPNFRWHFPVHKNQPAIGFLKWGCPQIIQILDGIFPFAKTNPCGVPPI